MPLLPGADHRKKGWHTGKDKGILSPRTEFLLTVKHTGNGQPVKVRNLHDPCDEGDPITVTSFTHSMSSWTVSSRPICNNAVHNLIGICRTGDVDIDLMVQG
jgi:hypothetical protein